MRIVRACARKVCAISANDEAPEKGGEMNAIEKWDLKIHDPEMYDLPQQAGRILLGDGITLFWADSDSLETDGETYDDWCLRANAEPA